MEYKEDIEQLFKDSFENFESDVHPDAWNNIQHSLNVQHLSNSAGSNGASVGTKAIVAGSKFGASYILGAVAVVSLTAGIIYFSSKENTPVKTEKPAEVSNEISEPQVVSSSAIINDQPEKKEKIKIEEKERRELKNSETLVPDNKKDEKEIQNTAANNSIDKNSDDQVLLSSSPKSAITENTAANEVNSASPQGKVQQSTPARDNNIDQNNSVNESDDNSSEVSADKNQSKNVDADKPDEYYLGNIPDVITPNADGKNDAFVIDGKKLKSLQVSIVNRSGKTIHQWNNLHGFWDGRLSNGQPAEAGTYFYNIFAQTENGKVLTKKNSLTLIR